MPRGAGVDHITSDIIGAAIHVHRELGPGLLKSTYETCVTSLLVKRGYDVQRQVAMPLVFDEQKLDCAYRLDMLVEGCVVVEIKTVASLDPVHMAQMNTYLKLSG